MAASAGRVPESWSTSQLAYRAMFADGMRAWQALTDEEKADYNRRGDPRHMTGHNLFLRNYLRGRKPVAWTRVRLIKEYTVGTSAEAAYTAPAGKQIVMEVLRAHNPNSEASNKIALWVVSDGETAADDNEVYVVSLPPDATVNVCQEAGLGAVLLDAGDALWAQSLGEDDVVNLSSHGWQESV